MNKDSITGQFVRNDFTGMHIYKLTPIRPVGSKGGYILWECKCDCGNIKNISSQLLAKALKGQRSIKSCGCIKRGRPELPNGEASFNTLFTKYKASAKKRGLSWNLTKEDTKIIFQQNCHYCGQSPKSYHYANGSSHKNNWGTPCFYNGIDRFDSSIGYQIDNCVPCCKICNMAKSNMKPELFYEWINRLSLHQLSIKK